MKPGDRIILHEFPDVHPHPYPQSGCVYTVTAVDDECVHFTDETGEVRGITTHHSVSLYPRFWGIGGYFTESLSGDVSCA